MALGCCCGNGRSICPNGAYKTAAFTGATVSDYASTLLFAATDARGFVAGQLGDGMVAVQRGDGTIPLFEPVRGEYRMKPYSSRHPTRRVSSRL